MITFKTQEEIAILKKGGRILSEAMAKALEMARPGVAISAIDETVHDYLVKQGGRPAFLGYGGGKGIAPFPSTVCISLDDEVVHGIGSRDVVLKEGQVVGFDMGVQYPSRKGLYTDMARTVGIGVVSGEASRLMEVTQKALDMCIALIAPGVYIHEIGKCIQEYAEPQGFAVVRDLGGHGVGHDVHEDPFIFNYFEPRAPKIEIKEGMVLALEPMLTNGGWALQTDDDGWTIRTADSSLSAHFEDTVVVTSGGCEVITR